MAAISRPVPSAALRRSGFSEDPAVPIRHLFLIGALIFTIVGVAAAKAPCVFEGQEYEHLAYRWDGVRCWICADGEWVQGQVQPELRGHGKY